MRVNGLIVAAGKGKRVGGETPKVFLPLSGRPIILHTLDRFAASRTVARVIMVIAESEMSRCEELIRSEPHLAALDCLIQRGGPRRQDSVALGLARLDPDCEVVAIHDGARPLVSPRLIDRCVQEALTGRSVVVGLPAQDTTKLVSAGGQIVETLSRDALWSIQTPQVFPVGVIREAYSRGARDGMEATDDAMLVERTGSAVWVLEGERSNIKVTFPQDLLVAETLLSAAKFSY
ncbi:MAG TPA: 2-C-methyl-D-erythritol 4-phosphate cytidylyltransferase [Candidatus Binatia bacterium]